MSDRDEFEEAAARMGYSLRMRDPAFEDGEYGDRETQCAWEMWQECCGKAGRAQGVEAVAWINQRGEVITNEQKHRLVSNQGIVGAATATNFKTPLYTQPTRARSGVMHKFRKKPVVIEAVQWDGTAQSASAIIDWILETGTRTARYHKPEQRGDCGAVKCDPPTFHIDTLEGTMIASAGDWIIRGVSDEHYPCKPDIFEKTYERAVGADDHE